MVAGLVPVCFVILDDVVWTPLDEKPKAVDDLRSTRSRARHPGRPGVSLLVDRWSEDWSELAWLRIEGVRPSSTASRRSSRPFAPSTRSTWTMISSLAR